VVDGCDVETLTLLMLKYGLAMCWSRKDTMKNLIQSLFPVVQFSSTLKRWVQDNAVWTIYVIFSLEKPLGKYVLKDCELPYTAFLPKGVSSNNSCAAHWNGAVNHLRAR
jgi:hypothetical protein